MLARSLAPIILTAALVACSSDRGPGYQTPPTAGAAAAGPRPGYDVEPHIYTVPAGRASEVRRLLGSMSYPVSVVTAQGGQTQFVQVQYQFTNDGRLVINAPAQYHPALAEILKQLPATTPGPTGYEVTYWIVRADAAQANAVAPDLAELSPVLDGLTAIGPRRFTMLDRLSARTSDGDSAELSGQVASVSQRLGAMPDAVDLDLELSVRLPGPGPTSPSTLETRLQVKPGVPVVLGDAASAGAELGAPAALLLYILRVRAI
jgi:hypothetical protein